MSGSAIVIASAARTPVGSFNGAVQATAGTITGTADVVVQAGALAHQSRAFFSGLHHGTMYRLLQTLHAGQDRTIVGEEVIDVAQEEVGFDILWIGQVGACDINSFGEVFHLHARYEQA